MVPSTSQEKLPTRRVRNSQRHHMRPDDDMKLAKLLKGHGFRRGLRGGSRRRRVAPDSARSRARVEQEHVLRS